MSISVTVATAFSCVKIAIESSVDSFVVFQQAVRVEQTNAMNSYSSHLVQDYFC